MLKFPPGLNEQTVRDLSALKNEPTWLLDMRLEAYHQFLAMPLPDFGPDLDFLDFQNICYFARPVKKTVNSWKKLPKNIRETYDRIGLPEAEKQYLGGVGAQYNSEVVYQNLKTEWDAKGVIFLDTDTAVQKYPELFREYFGKVVASSDNKFAALNTAVWSGGSFIYVPKGVKLTAPLQAYFRINIANLGQFERTLIIADEGAEVHYVEGCTAPIYSTDSLHSAVVEVVAKRGSRVRYTTIQNWSTNVVNLTTQRMLVESNAIGEWIDGNIGSKITMKYPAVVLTGEGARGDILSLAIAKNGQIQDNGGKAVHLAPNTSSTIVSKSVSIDGGICSYRGKIAIGRDAANAKTSTKCDALLMDERSISNTFPNNEIKRADASIAHEASVSRISDEQLFYLMSRGISENEALSMIVNGFVEPIIKNIPLEYAAELNRLIDLDMEGSVG
ncbi:Fe-S cluster assembly protein SufB [Candidatus Saccharibacteria bacterium]|nr:Fe-S cluster assembly protein SufB [Candidatus Saccharibacteria bacterium]MCL1962957.1 Fe-S cluster assembly protein SufB [Candidatus Saccharibacteria bacterium]